MPYFIENDNPDCSGWATVKQDGEVMGCHQTKSDAIDQMVALSIAEGIDPGGERSLDDPPAIIVDIDGTLLTFEGEPVSYVIDYVNAAQASVFVVTARVADDGETFEQLSDAGLEQFSLVMKPDADIDSVLYKSQIAYEILDDYNVILAIDDDADIRAAYQELGIQAVTPRSLRSSRAVRQVELNLPGYISAAASRGLELRADGFGGDGVTDRTVREARAMAAGDISEDKVIRANAWAARHAVDLDAPSNSDSDDDGWPGAGAVAHYLWGIDPLDPEPARNWFSRNAEEIQAERQKMTTTEMRQECIRRVEFRAAPSADGLTLEGYAAVFDEWTDIDDWEGSFRERIAPGAFKRTIGQRMPVLQFDHGSHPLIGSIPLGRITSLVEDGHGLRVKARLSDNWLVEPVRDAIRDGAISGMSFRFRVVDDNWTRSRDGIAERTIREVELFEVGPVVFPAYEQTSVGVRSRQTLSALQDPQIRGEIARMLISGTDIEQMSPAFTDGPDEIHPSEPDTPAKRHVSIPNISQRRAKLVLAGITKE